MIMKLVVLLVLQQLVICQCNRIHDAEPYGSSSMSNFSLYYYLIVMCIFLENTCYSTSWLSTGTTTAGGNEFGDKVNQFNSSYGVAVDSNGSVFVTDYFNHRVIKWERNASTGVVWAGGQCGAIDKGQLCNPTAITLDKSGNIFVTAEYGNDGSVIMFRQGVTVGKTLIFTNTSFYGITLDEKEEYLYVGHHRQHRVVKYKLDGTFVANVAGGNGQGNRLDQLNYRKISSTF